MHHNHSAAALVSAVHTAAHIIMRVGYMHAKCHLCFADDTLKHRYFLITVVETYQMRSMRLEVGVTCTQCTAQHACMLVPLAVAVSLACFVKGKST
jgi:hypothetical protein